jgi:hypothetical protein
MEDLFELFHELREWGRGEGEGTIQGDVDQNYQNSY